MVTSCVESLAYEQICLKMVTLYLIRSIHTWNEFFVGYMRNTERNHEFCFQLTGAKHLQYIYEMENKKYFS